MKFYQALQLDPSGLKNHIRSAADRKEQGFYASALVVRAVLLVLFSVLVITPVGSLFGPENSPMAVAMLCILLGIRFVDYGYCIRDSLVNMTMVFGILLVVPVAATLVPPVLAALLHVSAFFLLLLMTSDRPEMGNAGLYSFSYIYLAGNPVYGDLFWKRAVLTLLGLILCASILYAKHRKKNQSLRFSQLLRQVHLRNPKTQWQLQFSLGIGILLALGNFLGLKRVMWGAFACASILGLHAVEKSGVKHRFAQRILGTLAGGTVFFLGYCLLPSDLHPLFGLLGGLCLGFCTDYKYKTASNCLGALLLASGLYGLGNTLSMRLFHNLVGVAFGYGFWVLSQKFLTKFFPTPENA